MPYILGLIFVTRNSRLQCLAELYVSTRDWLIEALSCTYTFQTNIPFTFQQALAKKNQNTFVQNCRCYP